MGKKVINEVQDFLTVVQGDGERVYQIVNVELLLRRHPPQAVIAFLQQLKSEYSAEMGKLIKSNKTDRRIDDLVAKNFRVKMAINTIKNAMKEEREAA